MSATNTPRAAAGTKRRPGTAGTGLVLAVLAGAQFLVALDISIVVIAVPDIGDELHFSPSALQWVLNAYTLPFGGLLLLGGRLGDLVGRRRIFLCGAALFVAASLAGGFAQDQAWLIVSRAVQGVGAALLAPTAFSLVATYFVEGKARNKAFGVLSAVAGAASAAGVIAGGVLTELLSWRWVFFINVPVGALLFLGGLLVLTEPPRPRRKLDLLGALTVTGGSTALVASGINAAEDGWTATNTVLLFAVAVVLFIAFVIVQAKHSQPLVSLRLFADRNRSAAFVVQLLNNAVNIGFYYFLSNFAQQVFHYDPLTAGLALLPAPIAVAFAARTASVLLTKTGPLPILVVGGVLLTGGLYYASLLSPDSTYLGGMVPALVLVAAGFGGMVVPVTVTAIAGVAPQDSGMATGVLNACQQVGSSFGLAAMVSVFAGTLGAGAADPGPGVLTDAYDNALVLAACIAFASLVVAVLTIRSRPHGQNAS